MQDKVGTACGKQNGRETQSSLGKPRGTCNFEHRSRHIMRELYFNGPYRHTFRGCEMDSWHMRGMRHDSFEHGNGNAWVP
jgi:hypothetical protein